MSLLKELLAERLTEGYSLCLHPAGILRNGTLLHAAHLTAYHICLPLKTESFKELFHF